MNHPKVSRRDDFYSRQAPTDDLQRMAQENQQARINQMMAASGMGDVGMMGGQSLDELVSENHKEQQRRQYRHEIGGIPSGHGGNLRRLSMDFGGNQGSSLDTFQFSAPPMDSNATSIPNGSVMTGRRLGGQRDTLRRQSAIEFGSDTPFGDMSPSFGNLTQSPIFQQPLDADTLDLDPSSTFMQDVQMGMDQEAGLDHDVSSDANNLAMFSHSGFSMPMSSSMPQQPGITMRASARSAEAGAQDGTEQAVLEKMPQMNMSDTIMEPGYDSPMMISHPAPVNGLARGPARSESAANTVMQDPVASGLSSNSRSDNFSSELMSAVNSFTTSAALPNQPSQAGLPQYLNAYSQTGFDMLGILMRVAARPKPQINIGAVDMSCAFVVCDVTKHDIPIVYCSEMFERLTGYTRHEILGRNCRFLQAPDGKVQSGVKRKYVDDLSVYQLKKASNQLLEAQISLINYRKGGQPFMNLLTMIPIAWDTDEMKYYAGFQVDLVDQPASITNKNPGKHERKAWWSAFNQRTRWNVRNQLSTRSASSLRASHPRDQ